MCVCVGGSGGCGGRGANEEKKMIDTLSYLNAKTGAHWLTRLSPPTLKVDQQVAASSRPDSQYEPTRLPSSEDCSEYFLHKNILILH